MAIRYWSLLCGHALCAVASGSDYVLRQGVIRVMRVGIWDHVCHFYSAYFVGVLHKEILTKYKILYNIEIYLKKFLSCIYIAFIFLIIKLKIK